MLKKNIKESYKKLTKRKLKRKVSENQAERLMRISRFGKACKLGELDSKMVKQFLEERRLNIVSSKLPDASAGIAKKMSLFARLGLKDPVLDYFFKDHNKVVSKNIDKFYKGKKIAEHMIKGVKEYDEAILKSRKCMVNIGTIIEKHDTNFVVELPNKQKLVVQSDIPITVNNQKVLLHDGAIVDSVTEKEFKKYSKFYKEKLRDKINK